MLRLYILARSIFGQLFACAIAWFIGRQLSLGAYLLLSSVYQLVLLAYYTHFHFIPSLKLVATIRREALVVCKELLTGGFLLLEVSLVALYAGILLFLHVMYGHQRGLYLDAMLRAIAPFSFLSLILLFGFGVTWSVKTGQVSLGAILSYHNMLKWFGPFWWQIIYSLFSPARKTYMSELPFVRIVGAQVSKPCDLIFIQLESVGSPILQAEHNGQAVMPNMHGFSKEALFYPELISAKGHGGTSDVELAMFTGRVHESTDAPILDEFYDYSSSLFLPLKERGYAAFAFHGNTGAFYKRDYAYKKMGADFYDQARMGLPDAGWGAADGQVLRFVETRLAAESAPVVAAVILMSSHTPFTNILSIDAQAKGDAFERYCHSLRYVDREVANFIFKYRQRRPDTVFAIYGDHGTRIKDHVVSKTRSVAGVKRDLVPGWILGPAVAQVIEKNISMPDFAAVALSLAIRGEMNLYSQCDLTAEDALRWMKSTSSAETSYGFRQTSR